LPRSRAAQEAGSRRPDPKDPWAKTRVGELGDPLLPRWFVILGAVALIAAIGTAIAAFIVFGPEEVPVEARRPPPGAQLTHEVGEFLVGEAAPVPYDAPCSQLEGVRIAGTASDQALLRQSLAGLCNTPLPDDALAALTAFAADGGVVRFALFEATGIDSAAELDGGRILVNARFEQMGRARWIAPLVAHDAVMLAGDPETAETALRAREVEAEVCRRLLGTEDPSRACEDAEAVLDLPDPLAALRAVGYR
jgi:hypothetical protein